MLHYLTISYDQDVLRIPEHLFGLFFALGIDGVCITPYKTHLPYDSSAKIFWEKIKPLSSKKGEPNLYTSQKEVEFIRRKDSYTRFFPDEHSKTLSFEIGVNYKGVGKCTLKGSLDEIDFNALVCSRPYGRTWLHKLLSKSFNCSSKYVWFETSDNEEVKQEKLKEIAIHRLLDLLGILIHVLPPNGTLVGKIISTLCMGHFDDLSFVKNLNKIGLIKV